MRKQGRVTEAYVYNDSSPVKISKTMYVHVCITQGNMEEKNHVLLTAITLEE